MQGENFGLSAPFRVGVEEELFLVDPATGGLGSTDAVLGAHRRRFGRGQVLGELSEGVIELATPVCCGAREAVGRLAALRADVLAAGESSLLGSGLHPTAPFGAVRHRPGAHYAQVGDETRGLLRQSAYCGVHVHVGMPDAETAVAAFNGMRRWVPLLQALSANSPYWHGQDSGLASARTVVCHSVPRTGLPRAFRGWADYRDTVAELLRVAEVPDGSSIWWDMRIQPKLGTVEIRLLDAQSSLEDLEGLVALTHCLAMHEAVTASAEHPAGEVLAEATFRAIRDGLDARFSTGGPIRHVVDVAGQALALASGYAAELGCADSLERVEALLDRGNGAVRQRRAFAEGGFGAVLDGLVQETSGPPLEAAMAVHADTAA